MLVKSVSEMSQHRQELKRGDEVEVFLWGSWWPGRVMKRNKSGSLRVRLDHPRFKPATVEGTFTPSEVRPVGGYALKVGKQDENIGPNPKSS